MAADAKGTGVGLAILFRRVREGWDGMSYVKLYAWFTLWKVPCCRHGLCAEFSVFLLFVTLWLSVVTCLRSQLSAYEIK